MNAGEFALLIEESGSKDEEDLLIAAAEMGLLEDFFQMDENDENIPDLIIFSLDNYTAEECKLKFRFTKEGIMQLVDVLMLPEFIICDNGLKATRLEATALVLRRFSYPNRYSDLLKDFGRNKSELSRIFNTTVKKIHELHSHRLDTFNQQWLSAANIESFRDAITAKGCPMPNIFGFIDGTVRPCCRPVRDQRIVYNGHKRVHAIKFQSVIVPNGLIANLYGPMEGRRHDCALLRESQLLEKMAQAPNLQQNDGIPMALYGDPAYPVRLQLFSPFGGGYLTPQQQAFNKRMSGVRTSVEWGFGKVLQYFAFVDFKKNLKLLLQPIGKYYLVSVLLTNAHTCLYGSVTSSYFEIDPPSLEEYFAG